MKIIFCLILIVGNSITVLSQWQKIVLENKSPATNMEVIALSDGLLTRSGNILYSKLYGEQIWKPLKGNEMPLVQRRKHYGDTIVVSKNRADFSLSFSTDKGETWTDITSPLFSSLIEDFYISGNLIYVLSRTDSEPNKNSALFLSNDKGKTWEKVSNVPGGFQYSFIEKIGDTLFLARPPIDAPITDTTYSGVVRSVDKGKTWTTVNEGLGSRYISFLQAKGNILYAGTYNGLYASDNYGKTWYYAGNGMSASKADFLDFNADTLVCLIDGMVYQSIDNGTMWNSITDSIAHIIRTQGTFFYGLTVHKGNIYISSSRGLFRSSDNGQNWSKEQFAAANSSHYLYADGYRLYADTYDMGLWYSDDRGVSWQILDSNLSGLVEVAPAHYNLIVGENSLFSRKFFTNTLYRTDKTPMKWRQMNMPVPSGFVNSIMEWKESMYLSHSTGLYRSDTKGETWEKLDIKDQPTECINIRDTLYLLSQGGTVYQSTDGTVWNQILGSFYNRILRFKKTDHFMAIVLNTNRPTTGTFFLGLLSKDKGKTWDTLQFEVNDLLLHGSQILALSRDNGVFYSADEGKTWTSKNDGIDELDSLSLYNFQRIDDDLFIDGSTNYKAKFSNYLTSLNEEFIPQYFYAASPYPTPAKNNVRVKVYWGNDISMSAENIEIVNIFGEKVSNNQDIRLIPAGDFTGFVEWNCGAVAPGTYIMTIRHGTKTSVIKLSISH